MTIGILGGGQLGYMLALAGYPLGLRFRFLDPSPEAPVGRIAQRVTADFDDEAALEKFASGLELVTYEFENVPVVATKFLAERVPVFPPPAALEVAQDRLKEKALFRKLGIATTEFAPIHNLKSLDAAVVAIGLPAVLKTSRFGYDGKGQWILRSAADVEKLKSEIADTFIKAPSMNGAHASRDSARFILERFISFTRELSILGVRARNGDIVFYPLVQNRHHGGILRLSIAPAPSLAPGLQREAEDIARRILTELDYTGVLAIEFFEHQGRLVANEMAPRVHNSGHWTIEGAVTSQFENHLRAVLDLPLGSTKVYGFAAMLNLIGETPASAEVLAIPAAHLHLYGKSPRPGRKLGHITLWTSSFEQLSESLRALPPFFHQPSFCLDEPYAPLAHHGALPSRLSHKSAVRFGPRCPPSGQVAALLVGMLGFMGSMPPQKLQPPRVGIPWRTSAEETAVNLAKTKNYQDAVRAAGGEPVLLSLQHPQALQELLPSLDAFVLPGSPADVAPAEYGDVNRGKSEPPDAPRENTDRAILKHAFSEKKPVLAICYGCQLLNVYLGGTLIQDLREETDTPIAHSKHDIVPEPQDDPVHAATFEEASRLAKIAGTVEAPVNSSHHQAVERVGKGLQVTAHAPDGTIEAVEWTGDSNWVVGVQWHPERMFGDAFSERLFRDFVAAASQARKQVAQKV